MSEFRENLLIRMIHIYGFENELTIKYAYMLEKVPQTKAYDKDLETIIKCLELNPLLGKVFNSITNKYTK